MYTKIIVSNFLMFCLFFVGVFLLSSNVALAYKPCCGCYMPGCATKTWCHCPGISHCPNCAAPNSDLETVKFIPSTENKRGAIIISGLPEAVLASANEKMIVDIRRSIGRKNLMRKLVELESMKYARKFSCPQAEHTNLQIERLGFQAKVDLGN